MRRWRRVFSRARPITIGAFTANLVKPNAALAAKIHAVKPPRTDTGKPKPPTPATRYQDPTRARTADDVIANYATLEAKVEHELDRQKCAGAHGRPLVEGGPYVVIQTNGDMAIGTVPLMDDPTCKPVIRGTVQWIGRLPAEGWRDYAPVRATMSRRKPNGGHSFHVTWTIDAGRLTWAAHHENTHDHYGEIDSTSWTPLTQASMLEGEPFTITLDDRYLWPLRGLEWEIGTVEDVDAIVLRHDTIEVVVMGVQV